jgi:hypothetical protein
MSVKDSRSGESIDLRQLLKRMFPRPRMFAGSDNLEAIATYIEGFAFSKDAYWNEMRDFNTWLARKMSFSANTPWWVGLKVKIPDNDEAIQLLPTLFEEFWKQTKQKGESES